MLPDQTQAELLYRALNVDEAYFGAGGSRRGINVEDNLRHAYLVTRLSVLEEKLREKGMGNVRGEEYFALRSALLKRGFVKRRTNREIVQMHEKEREAETAGSPAVEAKEEPRKPKESVVEKYAFSGMFRIFDHHKKTVNRVCFANLDRTRLAMSCVDGSVSVVHLVLEEVKDISGRGKEIRLLQFPRMKFGREVDKSGKPNDLCWSASNDWILVAYESGYVVLYETATYLPMRVIKETVSATACRFHPWNSNHFVVGTASGSVRVYSGSTGAVVATVVEKGDAVCSLTFGANGSLLFCGLASGRVTSFRENKSKRGFDHIETIIVSRNRPINSISFHSWIFKRDVVRELLVSLPGTKSTLVLFRISEKTGKILTKEKVVSFSVKNAELCVRSVFCPLTPSSCDGACVVSGSEDSSVHIYDVVRLQHRKNPLITALNGHFGPVLDVCWAFDESLLASCDLTGVVIVWKRVVVESAE